MTRRESLGRVLLVAAVLSAFAGCGDTEESVSPQAAPDTPPDATVPDATAPMTIVRQGVVADIQWLMYLVEARRDGEDQQCVVFETIPKAPLPPQDQPLAKGRGCSPPASVDEEPLVVLGASTVPSAGYGYTFGAVLPSATRVRIRLSDGTEVEDTPSQGLFAAVFSKPLLITDVVAFERDREVGRCRLPEDGSAPC